MPYLIPLKELAETIKSGAVREEIKRDKDMFMFYSGANRDIIIRAIRKEFAKLETIRELEKRVVTLNLLRKIIDKLAQVYTRAPMRKAVNLDVGDQELLELYTEAMCFNQRMKEMNRAFKRDKRALLEFYAHEKKPQARVLPAHTYRVFSATPMNPSACDVIVQILDKDKFRYWDNAQTVEFNEKGETDGEPVSLLGPGAMNTMPFYYLNECTYSTQPIQSDDLLDMAIAIPITLTDMLFGLKFQCWSVIYTIGAKGKWTYNPNTVIELDFDEDGKAPIIDSVKPNMDVDKLLSGVIFLVEMLLTTNNLKAGEVKVAVNDAPSGVAKMIDSAETLENREDQEEYFRKAEREIFEEKLAKKLVPYWRATKEIDGDFDKEFSQDFKLSTIFQEPAVMQTEDEKVSLSEKRIKARLSTRKRELKKLHPEMSDTEIDELIAEIEEEDEKLRAVQGSGVTEEDEESDELESDLLDKSA
jgi:hypothetical protein